MKKNIESIVLTNSKAESLRIYQVEGSSEFCIGMEGSDHFSFTAVEAKEIVQAITEVVETSNERN
jgi:hypothetical protein